MKTHDTSATLLTVSELQSVKIAAENIESTIFYKFVIKSSTIWSEMLVIILCLRIRPLNFYGYSLDSVKTLSSSCN